MALDALWPDDRFALAPCFAAPLVSQERGEDRSDPESLASAICVGNNEQFRIVVAMATQLVMGLTENGCGA